MSILHRRSTTLPHLFLLVIIASLNVTFANDLNSAGQAGIIRTLSSETLGKTGSNFGGALKYGTEMDYISGPHGSTSVVALQSGRTYDRSTPHLVSGNVFWAYGVNHFTDVSIDLPLYYDIPGWNNERISGIGDLELAAKMAYPFGRTNAWLTHAYMLRVLLPTGSENRGFFPRHVYYLSGSTMNDSNSVFALNSVYFNPQMIWSMDFSRLNKAALFKLHFNFGGVVATAKSNSALTAAVGLEFQPNDLLTFFTEISGESRVTWYTEVFDIRSFINDPFRVTPGMKFTFENGMYLILAGDVGISKSSSAYRTNFERAGYAYSTKATPRYGAQITIGWRGKEIPEDLDRDSVPDEIDQCISLAEDRDGFQDADGCPDIDNDNDGILDTRDSCMFEPAPASGCPILDADNDNINDDVDNCVSAPEDYDNFTDTDGCPDNDNDNDGLPDASDKCPQMAEDNDGFEDSDGCADTDNDQDGVPDISDKCPAVKGTSESGGCPKTEEIKRGRLILDGVTFESGKTVLNPNSFTVLDRVYESLHEWENVKLEIRGHTDNQGNDQINLKLSQNRAETVMQYLISKGIAPLRLSATGMGESTPIADNFNAAGRAQNRRVELKRVD